MLQSIMFIFLSIENAKVEKEHTSNTIYPNLFKELQVFTYHP